LTGEKFNGFPKESLKFFADLAMNNNKMWFNDHKMDYDNYVLEPSKAFVITMGERIHELSDDIMAIPAVNKSLFRMNRDVRFSKDKSPYKTNLGILFWEGIRKRMECPGFYFHVETDELMLGGGMHTFPKDLIEPYRKAVVDDQSGKDLKKVIKTMEKDNLSVSGAHYKRVPQGYDPNHPNSELLKHNGLYTMVTTKVPKEFYSEKLIDFCYENFKKMYPLHKWILKYLL
jgi:uncharacterized protein (TIGR02453 family)